MWSAFLAAAAACGLQSTPASASLPSATSFTAADREWEWNMDGNICVCGWGCAGWQAGAQVLLVAVQVFAMPPSGCN